jgi:SH3-like domain-containing protein
MHGQGEAPGVTKATGRAPMIAALAAALSLTAAADASAERQTPSGFPVPRYVTLKFDKVNARAGPGDDHRLMWVYRVRGLPVQVVAETSEWRRICDPDGKLAWVHRRTTDGRRSALNLTARAQPLVKKPRPGAEVTAYLKPRSLAALDRCGKGWCRVKAPGGAGWVRAGALWGTNETPQCR